MFGHQINLNFDRKGDSHKTLITASVSAFIKMGMCCYIANIFSKLIFKLDDKLVTQVGSDDTVEEDRAYYSEMDSTFFWIVRDSVGSET